MRGVKKKEKVCVQGQKRKQWKCVRSFSAHRGVSLIGCDKNARSDIEKYKSNE